MKNEEHIDQCSAARVIGTGAPSPTLLNAAIASALGFIVEIQDDLVKCWRPEAGVPDETNWVPAIDFVLHETLCAEAFEKRGIQFFLLPADTGGWVCVFELDGELLRTSNQPDEGRALALGLHHLICADKDSQN
jgi:hypothetical protein